MLVIDGMRFKVDLKKFAEKMKIDVGTVRRRVAFDLYRRITMRTPVDTGRARLSWFMSDGAPSEAVAPVMGKGTGKNAHKGSPPATPKPPSPEKFPLTKNPFTVTYIVNNLPYIFKLEFGSSKQAPAGMVRVSLAEVAAELQSVQERLT